MRAFVVEFADADDSAVVGLLEGRAVEIDPDEVSPERRGIGALAERPSTGTTDPDSGEPA